MYSKIGKLCLLKSTFYFLDQYMIQVIKSKMQQNCCCFFHHRNIQKLVAFVYHESLLSQHQLILSTQMSLLWAYLSSFLNFISGRLAMELEDCKSYQGTVTGVPYNQIKQIDQGNSSLKNDIKGQAELKQFICHQQKDNIVFHLLLLSVGRTDTHQCYKVHFLSTKAKKKNFRND